MYMYVYDVRVHVFLEIDLWICKIIYRSRVVYLHIKQNLVLEILFILSVIPHYLVATCTRVRQELHMQSHGFHNYDY